MTELALLQCDGCERRISVKESDGWLSVNEVVSNVERYNELVARAKESGVSGAMSGDFCCLECLASWAGNASTLRDMEGGDVAS